MDEIFVSADDGPVSGKSAPGIGRGRIRLALALTVALVVTGGASAVASGALRGGWTDSPGWIDSPVTGSVTASNSSSFIRAAYQDFLGRQPTTAELDAGLVFLNQGGTRRAFVDGLAKSSEWASQVINKMYIDTLGRTGEPDGVAYWTNQLRNGSRPVASIAAEFYASQEYFEGFGKSSNQVWLRDLYKKLLLRTPDDAGIAHWDAQASKSRVKVAQALFQSNESKRQRVQALYQALLARKTDAAGERFWANRIGSEGDLALAADIAASDEYYNRSATRFP